MSTRKSTPKTLRNNQIQITEDIQNASDVLRSAQPYFDTALNNIASGRPNEVEPVKVPAEVLKNLVILVGSDLKRSGFLVGAVKRVDPGDGDWNPFNSIDFEFD